MQLISFATLWQHINIIIDIVIINFRISESMLIILFTLLLPLFCINLTSLVSFTWDHQTDNAHYYKINGSKAIQNDREGKLMHPLTSRQALPYGNTTVKFRIISYGQHGSPNSPVFNFGVVAGYNKQKPQVFNSLGALEYQIIFNTTTGSICMDARCPSQHWKQLFVPLNNTVQLIFDTTTLKGCFSNPGLMKHNVASIKEYWEGHKVYFFFAATNLGAEIQILS